MSGMGRSPVNHVVRREWIVHVERISHDPEIEHDSPRAGEYGGEELVQY